MRSRQNAHRRLTPALALMALAAIDAGARATHAAEWSGELGLEARWFPSDALADEQHGANLSALAEVEFYHDWDNGDQRFAMTSFLRADQGDPRRSHADLREFYWRKSFAAAELSIGLRKFFWGVTESRHLVDIINQTDFIEDVDGEDKLGQPMVHLSLIRDLGTVELFVMPWFRERTFAGPKGRPRPGLVVETDDARYESGANENHVDVALRWSHYVGDWDFGLAHFSGTARDPVFEPALNASGELVLVPLYEQLDQTSLDLQATKGSWLWKLELASREQRDERSTGLVAGFEYTFVGVFDTAIDLGIITEYLFDDAPGAGLENDVALGFRLAFNDIQSSELLAFSGVDADTQSTFTAVEGSRRIGQNWKLSLESRLFTNATRDDLFYDLRDDDYIEFRFSRFF